MQIDMAFVAVVAIVLTGVMQAIKQIPGLRKAIPPLTSRAWLVPFIAMALGAAIGVAAWGTGTGPETPVSAILSGVTAGLGSVGLYEVAKQVTR